MGISQEKRDWLDSNFSKDSEAYKEWERFCEVTPIETVRAYHFHSQPTVAEMVANGNKFLELAGLLAKANPQVDYKAALIRDSSSPSGYRATLSRTIRKP